jgi:hypothetical protein
MRIISIIVTFSLVLILGCGMGLIIKKRIIGNYFLVAADDPSDAALCFHADSDGDIYGDIIRPTVTDIGYNNNFILVKQNNPGFSTKGVKNYSYFIVPVKSSMDWKTLNGQLGPLSLNEFEQKKNQLHLTDIRFTLHYEDDE